MLSQEACEKILGIREKTLLSAEEMANALNITFFPENPASPPSEDVRTFLAKIRGLFEELHVNIVPYEDAFQTIPYWKVFRRFFAICWSNFLFQAEKLTGPGQTPRHYINVQTMRRILRRKKIKNGISIISAGDYDDGKLPIDNVSSFRRGSVITIVDKPPHITESTPFEQHFDTALSLSAHYMTNIVVLVKSTEWILYNFNASHPRYDTRRNFRENVLRGLIPKIAAPIRPLRLRDLIHIELGFNIHDDVHAPFVGDIVEGARRFGETRLYPSGRKIHELPFRSDFYRWIGALHLDNRSGMSYGFLARCLPASLSPLIPMSEAEVQFPKSVPKEKDYFFYNEALYVIIEIPAGRFCLAVPEVWVLSQRSGSNKTNVDPERDLVKLGLKNGRMYIQAPRGLRLTADYRPSFDTAVILSHAVGNAIVASILAHLDCSNKFAAQIRTNGSALIHWHGYMNPRQIPEGWIVHGEQNPHVACSSPQSALYAIRGKLEGFHNALTAHHPYKGDVHIEPHHGTNVMHSSLREMVELFIDNPNMASLGNEYLELYLVESKP